MSDGLTHLNSSGEANMVDVTGRDVTVREAVASGEVKLSSEVVHCFVMAQHPKVMSYQQQELPASWQPRRQVS